MYQSMRDLLEMHVPLKIKIKAPPKIVYKTIKGDEIDVMFGEAMQKAGCQVPVKREGPGKYMFGTRNIIAKIVNNKLLIRVGGGFMSIDEFIEQYGPMEMLKIAKQEQMGLNTMEKKEHREMNRTLGMGEMKNMMRSSMQLSSNRKKSALRTGKESPRDE